MTVIELMIVVTIAAIMLTIAVPSFTAFVNDMRLRSNTSDLNADLLLARSEAIRRNSRVLVCPRATASATTCATAVTAGTWMNGWLVCYDANSDGACDVATASDPNPIRVRAALKAPLSLSGPLAAVTFFPIGNANSAATFTMTGGSSSSRSIQISPTGVLTSSKS